MKLETEIALKLQVNKKQKTNKQYCTVMPPYPLIQYPQFIVSPKKKKLEN
jgi:hypothetical protein